MINMLIIKKCFFCKKKFHRNLSPDNIKRGKGKYCSMKCSNKDWKKQYKEGKIIPYFEGLKKGHGLMKGKHYPFNHPIRKAISESLKGKNGPLSRNWQGGIYLTNCSIRRSPPAKQWRNDVLKRDNYECQICGTKKKPFNANHIKKFSKHLELRFDVNNGITLCKYCHEKLVNWHEPEWESYFKFNLETRNVLCFQN